MKLIIHNKTNLKNSEIVKYINQALFEIENNDAKDNYKWRIFEFKDGMKLETCLNKKSRTFLLHE